MAIVDDPATCNLRFGAVFLTVLISFSICPEIYSQQNGIIKRYGPDRNPDQDTIHSPVSEKQLKHNRKSSVFYDSIFNKFSRTKFSKALYDLTFVPPGSAGLPDTVHYLKSEIPFQNDDGKIIRKITIYSLDPFVTSVTDTLLKPKGGVGKLLNDIHIETKKSIIRKNLFFKPGQTINAGLLAENEKLLRESNAFDNASIIVVPVESCEDSADVIVITKDVWSIGIGFGAITSNRAIVRLYDANFLGFGNPFSNQVSFRVKREPFFRYDGANYVFKNIGGYFLDYSIGVIQDDDGNQNFYSILQRDFYSNNTKWAGGAGFNYFRDVNIISDSQKIVSYYNTGTLWGGKAFFFSKTNNHPRVVILESAYLKYYSSRPQITADTNKRYYNMIRLLTGLAISQNKYYLTHYVTQFGKTENIPYGYLIQGAIGPEFNDFYNRLFGGLLISSGNFLGNAGYFYGRLSLGGYIEHQSFQDAVLKIHGIWLSPLQMVRNKKFKFRTYLWSDYRLGFNFLKNNDDHADLETIIDISGNNGNKQTEGVQSLSASLMTVMFTPWQFYGFKFAIMARIQGGMIAQNKEPIFAQPFYSGIKVGFLVKNDNLVLPALVFSAECFFHPPQGNSMFYFNIDTDPYLNITDFNVRPVNVESLEN